MGARCTFVFKQSEDLAVALYSHWGEDSMHSDLAQALQHAVVRKGDTEYYTRMAVSHLLKDSILDETGFGIYSITGSNYDLGETTVVIDIAKETIIDNNRNVIGWVDFINAYAPKVLVEQV